MSSHPRSAGHYLLAAALLVVIFAAIILLGMYFQRQDLSPEDFETDPASLSGPTQAVDGVVRRSTDTALTGGLMLEVTGEGGREYLIVLNRHTVCRWPDSWGPAGVDPGAVDVPDVILPARLPLALEGVEVRAHVKQARLGLFQKPWFAADVSFLG